MDRIDIDAAGKKKAIHLFCDLGKKRPVFRDGKDNGNTAGISDAVKIILIDPKVVGFPLPIGGKADDRFAHR